MTKHSTTIRRRGEATELSAFIRGRADIIAVATYAKMTKVTYARHQTILLQTSPINGVETKNVSFK